MDSPYPDGVGFLFWEYPTIPPLGRSKINFDSIPSGRHVGQRNLDFESETDRLGIERPPEHFAGDLTVHAVGANSNPICNASAIIQFELVTVEVDPVDQC